jgi:hypothetical protein
MPHLMAVAGDVGVDASLGIVTMHRALGTAIG